MNEFILASKMKNKEIISDRDYGGVSICYHTNIKCAVETIPCKSKSICALKVKFEKISKIVINVYINSSDDIKELDELYWNADTILNDGRTKLFKEFIKNSNLYKL